jgi:DNA repair exonuclease SbcCD ATPase subunit
MANYQIKSVAFGGFDKQDVISYIERTASEAAAAQRTLQEEIEALNEELERKEQVCFDLRNQLDELIRSREEAEDRLAEESAVRSALEPLKQEAEQLRRENEELRAENERLQPDALAYAQFRANLGAIEFDARKRAADLEAATQAQLRRTVDQFRRQYQVLMSTFETTAAHVNSELRKVEVNLTQLPRAMDQSGSELNELAAMLERKKED